MPYFFGRREGDRVSIEGADARHLVKSLRARPGETISVVDPAGLLLTVRLESVAVDLVAGKVVAEAPHQPEPAARIVIGLALLPGPALDEALARCTELGAAGFIVVRAGRSVAREAKPERWSTICREAAMLAGRAVVPTVEGPALLEVAWGAAQEPFLLDRAANARLAELAAPRDLTLFVGPEGGWTPEERALAGDRQVGLGARNLRAQTAAAAALAVALSVRGDL